MGLEAEGLADFEGGSCAYGYVEVAQAEAEGEAAGACVAGPDGPLAGCVFGADAALDVAVGCREIDGVGGEDHLAGLVGRADREAAGLEVVAGWGAELVGAVEDEGWLDCVGD